MRKSRQYIELAWLILVAIIKDAIFASVASGVLCLFKYIGSLLGWCGRPTWLYDFLGGALGVFVLLVAFNGIAIVVHFIRCWRDPVFKDASERSGMRWRDYKRWRDADKNKYNN